ncbi:MAG: Ysc84 actin-binding domain protein [Pirellulales bacterium]|nr:Ysc84 actin-binding domain protein [Pirellulales bacterium]
MFGPSFLVFLTLSGVAGAQSSREAATVDTAARVLQENIAIPVRGIPQNLLTNAQAIAIVPDVVKLGFVLAGRRGHGVIVVRNADGSWSNPVFITLTGGSIGWQAGVQSTDVILVFKSRKSVNHVLDGQFTLGADAGVAAGPVGRQAAAATDIQLRAEIYSYSRSRGLFAGVSLDGSVLEVNPNANAAFYGTFGIGPHDILGGKTAQTPANVVVLKELLAQHAPPAAGPMPSAQEVPPGGAAPALGADAVRQQLAGAWQQLSARLDDGWRGYLALPPEILATGPPPSDASIREALKRFDTAAADPQYRALAQMPEFQATHSALRVYASQPAAGGQPQTSSRVTLPPPPTAGAPRNY